MNAALSAALARYAAGPRERREALHRRREEWSESERIEAAALLASAGHHRAAALWLAAGCRLNPGSAQLAYRFGNALRLAGHDRAATAVLAELCGRYPAWAEPAQSLAWLYRRQGRGEEAAAVLERWLRAAGRQPRAVGAVAEFLQEMGMAARAEALLATAPAAERDPGLRAERASLLLKLGRFEEGETILRALLRDAPGQAGAWLRLAQVRRWEDAGDSPLELMQAAWSRADLDAPTRAAIGFAIAKVDDDLGRYREAWEAAAQANVLRARTAHFDRAGWERFEHAVYRTFTPDFFAAPGDTAEAEAPVFIVGMPRSGTTLLERRLGRHPSLVAAGELELIEKIGAQLVGAGGYPEALAGAVPEGYVWAAREWRARLPVVVAGAPSIIDKNPLNFLHLGLIARIFPHARILHCRRNPLDTALSIWLQNFAHPRNDYAYRESDLAWVFAMYRRLMAHWEEVLPVPLCTVEYEELVADPEKELRRATERLGLAWEPALLDDGRAADGVIATASLWQARQPVYRHAVDRARNYEPWIAPLREALAREGIA